MAAVPSVGHPPRTHTFLTPQQTSTSAEAVHCRHLRVPDAPCSCSEQRPLALPELRCPESSAIPGPRTPQLGRRQMPGSLRRSLGPNGTSQTPPLHGEKLPVSLNGCLPENHTSQEAQRPRDLGAPRDHGLGFVRNYTALRLHWDRPLGKQTEDNSRLWRIPLPETNGSVYMRCEDNESPNREPMFPRRLRGCETSFGSFLCLHRRFPP